MVHMRAHLHHKTSNILMLLSDGSKWRGAIANDQTKRYKSHFTKNTDHKA